MTVALVTLAGTLPLWVTIITNILQVLLPIFVGGN